MFVDFFGTSAWCVIDGRGRDEDEGATQTPTATE
jgi:hypothetical protein